MHVHMNSWDVLRNHLSSQFTDCYGPGESVYRAEVEVYGSNVLQCCCARFPCLHGPAQASSVRSFANCTQVLPGELSQHRAVLVAGRATSAKPRCESLDNSKSVLWRGMAQAVSTQTFFSSAVIQTVLAIQSATALAPDMTKTKVLFVCLGEQHLHHRWPRCQTLTTSTTITCMQATFAAAQQLKPFSRKSWTDQELQTTL